MDDTQRFKLPRSLSDIDTWDQSNPFLKTKQFPINTFSDVTPGSVILLNTQNEELGLGIFSPEINQISFLSKKNRTLEDHIRNRLQTAYNSRPTESAYRFIHHKHDQLPGLIVEIYNNQCFIRTYESGWDPYAELIAEIIDNIFKNSDTPLKGFWLKNHFTKRLRRGLLLSDGLIRGTYDNPILEIQESDQVYQYNLLKNIDLFPVHLRELRRYLNQIEMQSFCNLTTNEIESLIPQNRISDLHIGPPFQLDEFRVSETTQSLRLAIESGYTFDTIVLPIDGPLESTPKLRTAFGHLLRTISNGCKSGQLNICTTGNKNNQNIIKRLGQNLNTDLKMTFF